MTDLESKFVDAFVVLRKGAPAARKAGYSVSTARQQAHKLLKNQAIKDAIAARFKELTMSADEAAKDFSDIARTRLNDYLKVNRVLKTPTVRKPLQQLINELDAEMEFEEEFARVAKLSGDELKVHQAEQKRRELQGIRYTLELERNPNAYRDVKGESIWVEDVSIDLVALAKAKQRGRIKKLKIDADGTTAIEMYAADNALSKVLEIHGKLKAPGETTVNLIITPDDVKAFKESFDKNY